MACEYFAGMPVEPGFCDFDSWSGREVSQSVAGGAGERPLISQCQISTIALVRGKLVLGRARLRHTMGDALGETIVVLHHDLDVVPGNAPVNRDGSFLVCKLRRMAGDER